jgi:hypothetical protein
MWVAVSDSPKAARKPGRGTSIQVAVFLAICVAVCCLILLAAIFGIAQGRWSALFSDPGNFTDFIIPSVAFLVTLVIVWRKGGWLGVKEGLSLKTGYLATRYGHYKDAVKKASWAESDARRAEKSDPGSDKAKKLSEKAQEAKADLQLRRAELRRLKQDLCDTFAEDKGLAEQLDDEFPVPAEPEPETT